MSCDVAAEARARFTDAISADAYTSLFKRVMAEPPPPWTPRRWAEFRPDANFPDTWRRLIPVAAQGENQERRELFEKARRHGRATVGPET